MSRIKIPFRFYKKLSLAELIIKRHEELGNKSPLSAVFDMDTFKKNGKNASIHNTKKGEYEKLAENETELRNNSWGDGTMTIRNIAQFLKAMHSKNPHELGKWGFEVDSSPQKKKKKEKKEPESNDV